MTPRSWLFVPGDRPDRIEKALETAADAIILDLEDSVHPARKACARETITALLQASPRGTDRLWVRINPLSTRDGLQDIQAVASLGAAGLLLPKATPEAVRRAAGILAAEEAARGASALLRLLPIATETAEGFFSLPGYADCADRLVGITWGAEDLSAALGALNARDERGRLTQVYQLVRSVTVLAAGAAGVPAIETIYPNFRDLEGLAAYAQDGKRDGFVGMMAIHPCQVPVINEAFTPSATEIAAAEQVVAAFEAQAGAGVVALDGRMLDAPHLAQAHRLVMRRRNLSEE